MPKKEKLAPTHDELTDTYSAHKEAAIAVGHVHPKLLAATVANEKRRRDMNSHRLNSRKYNKAEDEYLSSYNQLSDWYETLSIEPHSDTRKAILHYAYVTEDARRKYKQNPDAYRDLALDDYDRG